MSDKLLAEWFWTDRWIGSSAFLLPMEARGVYREMLTQAWRRGARLPNDHEAIRRAIGATVAEWRRAWPSVQRFWRVDGDNLVNDTQQTVYADAQAKSERASQRGLRGAQARHKHSQSSSARNAEAPPEHKPPSPSPSPISVPTEPKSGGRQDARSKRPIFSGQRLTVFEWMLDDLTKLLGNYTESFDLHQWFFDLDEQMRRTDMVIPQRDGGAWLQAETLKEAQRRGLPVAVSAPLTAGKLTTRLAAAMENIRREAGS
jgi:uncharacterized protein YdaU (DUF1376 family)